MNGESTAPVGKKLFAGAFLLSLLTKLPFMGGAYGSDYDNSLVAQAARQIARDGEYYASRFPGNPLQELTYSLLPNQQPWAFHLLTALLSAAAAGLFGLLALQWRAKNPWLLTGAFILLPAFFVNSVTALDYNWSLAFMLASLYAAHRDRPYWGGVALGLATGCRLVSIFIGLPFALLFFVSGAKRPVRGFIFAVLAVLVSAACFMPAYRAYGMGFFQFYGGTSNIPKLVYRMTAEVWGELGFLSFIGVAAVVWKGSRSTRSAGPRDRTIMVYVVSIILNFLIFLRAPFEGEYLLPAATLALLLVGRFFSRHQLAIVCAAFALSLVVGVAKDGSKRGKLVEELQDRNAAAAYADHLLKTRAERPENAVVIASQYQPLVELRSGAPVASSIESRGKYPDGYNGFYRSPNRKTFDEWISAGIPVYAVEGITPGDLELMGYNPADHGAKLIPKQPAR
ncbi:MAG TPA: hypothetical protein VEX38_04435 [Fimbriimonadaceae bacterium]|nr:hypothetical protein [Fimbriimonadaceae bacterium]